MSIERVRLDIKYIQDHPTPGIIVCEVDDFRNFEAIVSGPMETPYESGLFTLSIKIPTRFPMKPPEIRFTSPVWHPNIAEHGSVCLDILDDEWSPAITLLMALEAIQGLLRNPNEESPLNVYAGRMLRENKDMFDNTAKTWTHHFAGGEHCVPEMEEKLQVVSALKRDTFKALKLLSRNDWVVEELVE